MNNFNQVFLNNMQQLLGKEYNDFLQSLNNPNEKAIFVNTNKISVEKFLNSADFPLEKIDYEKSGFYIGNQKLGKHPLHHAGAFYVQEPSAMFTLNAFNFKGDEKVLDLCAAPGGKSIQIATRIPNGILVSNEINKKRSEILFSNIERMGLKNVIITNDTPEKIAKAYANTFDVCLVDAPCSGEGMFRKGDDMVASWNENLNEMCAKRQLEILENANDVLKQNGFLIYSTCTYSKLENEDVVNQFMQKHNYKLIPIKHSFSKGIDMPETARLYPHIVKGEGQFVAVLQKLEENDLTTGSNLKLRQSSITNEFLKKNLKINITSFIYDNYSYYVADSSLIKKNINYVSLGVKLANTSNKNIEVFHNLFTAFGNDFNIKLELKNSDILTKKYIRGETFDVDLPDGYGAIIVDGCALGGFKISKGSFKNHYPKGLRNFD